MSSTGCQGTICLFLLAVKTHLLLTYDCNNFEEIMPYFLFLLQGLSWALWEIIITVMVFAFFTHWPWVVGVPHFFWSFGLSLFLCELGVGWVGCPFILHLLPFTTYIHSFILKGSNPIPLSFAISPNE